MNISKDLNFICKIKSSTLMKITPAMQLFRANFWHFACEEGGGEQNDKSLEKVLLCAYPQKTILTFYKGKHENIKS